ncbi:MAG: hypothetical protein D6689_09875 [Deltaproteobacteria bacterium]|nr:MAG: hypothetical protein D6689_09875 [Deltaproteobacteria bacterium]
MYRAAGAEADRCGNDAVAAVRCALGGRCAPPLAAIAICGRSSAYVRAPFGIVCGCAPSCAAGERRSSPRISLARLYAPAS